MKKLFFWFIIFAAAVFLTASCTSQEIPRSNDGTGILTVTNIPQKYIGGIILVSGENSNGESFTYSPKILQKCDNSTMRIKIYSSVRSVQTPFLGNGEFLVTVSLYEPVDHEKSEIKQIRAGFTGGSAVIRW
jgi:hypothetical protein